MTKKDFIEKYAAKTGASKKAAGEYVEAFLETVEEVLMAKDSVQFVGWGTFEVKETAARQGRNPKTGEAIDIPAKKAVKFKVGKKLQDKVNA
jgi:DNA-binding protein HU-beta